MEETDRIATERTEEKIYKESHGIVVTDGSHGFFEENNIHIPDFFFNQSLPSTNRETTKLAT